MTFYQKLLLNTVLTFVSILVFFEKKLIDFIKGSLLIGLNVIFFGFVYINSNLFPYLISGVLATDTYITYNFNTVLSDSSKSAVLGYSTVSLARELPPPSISSQVALVMDKNTDKELFELNSSQEVAPASTTKLMTALVSLDIYNKEDVLEVPSFCTTVDGSKVGLPAKKFFTVEKLLHALLIQSGADAACVLSTGKGSYDDFVKLMNDKAKEIGMNNTSFTNPIGLDGINGSHYSTAKDLYVLSKKATSNIEIANIVKLKDSVVASVDEKITLKVNNTNKLLWEIPNTIGVKTGTTVAAGEVLIYEYLEEAQNIDLVIIVMNSSDRFYDTKNLLNWTLGSYSWSK